MQQVSWVGCLVIASSAPPAPYAMHSRGGQCVDGLIDTVRREGHILTNPAESASGETVLVGVGAEGYAAQARCMAQVRHAWQHSLPNMPSVLLRSLARSVHACMSVSNHAEHPLSLG